MNHTTHKIRDSSTSEKKDDSSSPAIALYINSLSSKEYKAYCIAKSHLQTSFSIEKSNGYQKFLRPS